MTALPRRCEDCGSKIAARKRFCADCIAAHRKARRKLTYERQRSDPQRWAALLADARERQRQVVADPKRLAARRKAQARWRQANREKVRANSARYLASLDEQAQAARRERNRRWRAEQRAIDPERERAANRRYRAKLRADPKRHAETLEKARMDYRLRQERKGRELAAIRKPAVDHTQGKARNGHGPPRWAPLAPLAGVMQEWAQRNDAQWRRLARLTGMHEDELYLLAKGTRRYVHYRTADRVLVSLGSTLAAHYDLETLQPLAALQEAT